jgi:methyl-accepting chemotaxis protein
VTTFHKRKQFWIDSPLQLQMLGYVLFLVAASLLLVSFSILRGLSTASAQSRQIFHSLDWVRQTILEPLLLSSSLSILASGLIVLIWSHRFAGPLRVLSAGFSRLKQGNLAVPIRIRATDSHQELVKEFAQAQEALHERLKKIERAAKKLADSDATRELKDALSEFEL